jgi:hypothetical protein
MAACLHQEPRSLTPGHPELQINGVLEEKKKSEVNLNGVSVMEKTCKFKVEFEVASLKTTSGLAWID